MFSSLRHIISTEICSLIVHAVVKQNQGAGFDKQPLCLRSAFLVT